MAVFTNPLLAGDYPDPSLVRDGEDYYMTYSCGYLSPGLKILHSRDLIHWKTINTALRGTARNIAAPELIHYNGLFYIYYPEGSSNYVITAENPAGRWSDPVDLHVGGIDPGHIVTPDHKRYLYFSGGYAARLSPDGLSLTEKPVKVYNGWQYGERYITEGFWLESPKLFRRNGYYYLVCAQGGTAGPATAHMAVVARSVHPLGPWENMPTNPLVHTDSRLEPWWCKGHGTVFEDHQGGWWIVYHAYQKDYLNHGRKALLQKVTWSQDGWPHVDAGASAPMFADVGTASPCDTLDDEFTGPSLQNTWCFRGDPSPARYAFTPEGLSLEARGVLPGDSAPMTVTLGRPVYFVETRLTRGQDVCAGLLLQYNETHYVGVGWEASGIRLYKYGAPYVGVPYNADQVDLRLINDHHCVYCAYSENGTQWHTIPYGFEVSGLNHNALNGYDSLRPGLFACGKGNAVFRYFHCHEYLPAK